MNIDIINRLKNKNVLCLLSESKGSTKQGYTTPKHRISDSIETYFENCDGRIIMSLYSQNLFRIIEILELAKKYKQRVFFSIFEYLFKYPDTGGFS